MHPLEIESQRDELPSTRHGIETAKQELAKAHHVLDDPEHRFDAPLAPTITRPSFGRFQPPDPLDDRVIGLHFRCVRPQTFLQRHMV